jgi:nicotinamidase-related amidase
MTSRDRTFLNLFILCFCFQAFASSDKFQGPGNSAATAPPAKKANDSACPEKNAKPALVLIDMQPHFLDRTGKQNRRQNKAKVKKAIDTQIAAIKKAKKAKIPIVIVEYECPECDSTDSRLQFAVANYQNVRFIKKDADGMFDNENSHRQELIHFLNKKSIGTLIIMGANGGACVLDSITRALANNCNVVAFDKGIADFNYDDFMYPYVGQYSQIKPECENCSFKETTSIEKIADVMLSSSTGSREASSDSSNAAGAK